MKFGPQAYAHPVETVIVVALCMPLLANIHAVVAVMLWRIMRRNWLDTKQLWRTR